MEQLGKLSALDSTNAPGLYIAIKPSIVKKMTVSYESKLFD
jgi:hypothetical protein